MKTKNLKQLTALALCLLISATTTAMFAASAEDPTMASATAPTTPMGILTDFKTRVTNDFVNFTGGQTPRTKDKIIDLATAILTSITQGNANQAQLLVSMKAMLNSKLISKTPKTILDIKDLLTSSANAIIANLNGDPVDVGRAPAVASSAGAYSAGTYPALQGLLIDVAVNYPEIAQTIQAAVGALAAVDSKAASALEAAVVKAVKALEAAGTGPFIYALLESLHEPIDTAIAALKKANPEAAQKLEATMTQLLNEADARVEQARADAEAAARLEATARRAAEARAEQARVDARAAAEAEATARRAAEARAEQARVDARAAAEAEAAEAARAEAARTEETAAAADVARLAAVKREEEAKRVEDARIAANPKEAARARLKAAEISVAAARAKLKKSAEIAAELRIQRASAAAQAVVDAAAAAANGDPQRAGTIRAADAALAEEATRNLQVMSLRENRQSEVVRAAVQELKEASAAAAKFNY